MKINNPVDSLQTGTAPTKGGLTSDKAETAGKHAARPVAAVEGAPTTGNGSSIKLSDLSSKLQKIESQLASGDSFDAKRVSEIKQSIRDGSFKVDSHAVADKLLAGANDLFVKRH